MSEKIKKVTNSKEALEYLEKKAKKGEVIIWNETSYGHEVTHRIEKLE